MSGSQTEQALRRLRRSSSAIWLVQGNPRSTDIFGTADLPHAWCIKRHTSEVRHGDRVVLWLSGAGAGVYALGEIAADPGRATPPAGDGAGSSPVIQAPLDLYLDLRSRPVERVELKADPRFADESIVRQPFAANPHRLSVVAFDAILDRVPPSC